jgi:hypothetical protein
MQMMVQQRRGKIAVEVSDFGKYVAGADVRTKSRIGRGSAKREAPHE